MSIYVVLVPPQALRLFSPISPSALYRRPYVRVEATRRLKTTIEALRRLFGLFPLGPQARPQPQAQYPEDVAEGPGNHEPLLVPIIMPSPEEAALGPMRGIRTNAARKRKFENIIN
jgi:hypothetical protein